MTGHLVVGHVDKVLDKGIVTVQIRHHQFWEITVQEILLNMNSVFQRRVQVITIFPVIVNISLSAVYFG